MRWWRFKEYVPVARRRANGAREAARLAKQGRTLSPIKIAGRAIAGTFWGKAWCENLEAYSDYSNRLPRGRSYVRNGSVLDLQLAPGLITALVVGSQLYEVRIKINGLTPDVWAAVKRACAGQISSLVELLQGRLSKNVMEVVTRQEGGLFPKPREIKMSCSCPDSAGVCKHIAAVFYGVGARLDKHPELLFQLREVDHLELVTAAVEPVTKAGSSGRSKRTIAAGELGDVFGIELAESGADAAQTAASPKRARAAKSAKAASPAASKRGQPKKVAPKPGGPSSSAARPGRSKKKPQLDVPALPAVKGAKLKAAKFPSAPVTRKRTTIR